MDSKDYEENDKFGDTSGEEIPLDWETLDVFRSWYLDVGLPLLPAPDAVVYRTDNASAVSLFRQGRFQVELYLIDSPDVPRHSHPDLEIVQMFPSRIVGTLGEWILGATLAPGEWHGFGKHSTQTGEFFNMLLVFQRWPLNSCPTSATVAWLGETDGPIHDALIKKHNPLSLVRTGYAESYIPSLAVNAVL